MAFRATLRGPTKLFLEKLALGQQLVSLKRGGHSQNTKARSCASQIRLDDRAPADRPAFRIETDRTFGKNWFNCYFSLILATARRHASCHIPGIPSSL